MGFVEQLRVASMAQATLGTRFASAESRAAARHVHRDRQVNK